MKTYRDSYLYNKADRSGQNMMKKHDSALISYIMKAQRIDKNSEAFSGIVEEVKRQQTSSLLYQVLLMDNVFLCIGTVELPPAFKVFEAFDMKDPQKKPAVFIDVTKLISMKGGYYDCKDIGKLITYLMGALTYLLYRYDVAKMVNNSALTIAGTECYVAMFNYILDYLRIIGYSANKERISYLVGLFYQNSMLGKEIDTYTKNMAAKAAKIAQSSVAPMDLFLEDGIFENIDTFITFIAETFKLKGLTTEVFIQKWIYLYGNGSQYACELYTSFSVLLSNAFCGAYVSNQKQIERCCGQSMVQYCNALLRAGVDAFGRNTQYMESAMMDTIVADPRSMSLSESMKLRNANTSKLNVVIEDFCNSDVIKAKVEATIDYYNKTNESAKISKAIDRMIEAGFKAIEEMCEGNIEFNETSFNTLLKEASGNYTKGAYDRKLNNLIERFRDRMTILDEAGDLVSAETASRYGKGMKVLFSIKGEI